MIYVSVTATGIYSDEINKGILLGSLAVLPSGLYACVQSALLGTGQSHYLGKLNLAENLVRCSIGIVLVLLNKSVFLLIAVFVATRWLVAAIGFNQLKIQLGGRSWKIDASFIQKLKSAAPKFALIIAASLVLRNAGLLVIPALSNLTEAGRYAVSYQLYDLMLILPSVLAMTSIHLFSNKAMTSRAGLQKAAINLANVISVLIFPIAAITAAFSKQVITLFYGDKYLNGEQTLMILMFAAGLTMIDIVLSQVMQARKDYKNDMISIIIAALCAAILTYILTLRLGANGAAFALVIALAINILARSALLGEVFPLKLLLLSTWRPFVASLVVFVLFRYGLKLELLPLQGNNGLGWLLWVPVAMLFYVAILWLIGGLKYSHYLRLKQFLFKH